MNQTIRKRNILRYRNPYLRKDMPIIKKKFMKYENETELSKEVWWIKRSNYMPQIEWKILRVCPPFNQASRKCCLCLKEKLEIALEITS